MTTKQIVATVAVIVAVVAIYYAYQYPQFQSGVGGTSAVGTTFNSAKVAAISFAPAAPGATTTSILNGDANDRYVLSNFVACNNATSSFTAVTGTGLANLIFQAATTSTNAPVLVTNTNLVMNDIVATGTVAAGAASNFGGIVLAASSSVASTTAATGVNGFTQNANAGINAFKFVWSSGSYLTFVSNATNTAACTVGVYYLAS